MFFARNPKRFWDWFSYHEKEFYDINEENMNQIFDKVVKYLEKYNKYIGFEFVSELQDGKRELIVTADGAEELFETVFNLVNAAPEKLKDRWIFTALRQPSNQELNINYEGISIQTKDIFYEIEESEDIPDKWDILLNIKGIKFDRIEQLEFYEEITYILIEDIIGEYLAGTKIEQIILVNEMDLENPKNIMELRKDIEK
ncbi:hypothetical protein [Bacillus cereus]|uniref:hypothetical protein n=1 Tax=Bacillus cereus TaxID=1396 RepID=UPI000B4AED7A|nr:hypothetical protein [Bacillus cereus]